jgi:hypothetical protein
VGSTSNSGASTVNTDGADTINANNITFNRWTVINGDDGLSRKANSTLHGARSYPISITQCITFSGVVGDCNTSELEIEDIAFPNVRGTLNTDRLPVFSAVRRRRARISLMKLYG